MKEKIKEAATEYQRSYSLTNTYRQRQMREQSFIHGANFALENQWHDLILNPNDLPPIGKEVIVQYENSEQCYNHRTTDGNVIVDKYGFCVIAYDNALAWMEIPKFKLK